MSAGTIGQPVAPSASQACGTLRVLYVHCSAGFTGSAKSLIELHSRLRERGVHASVLVPAGAAARAFAEAGMRVHASRGLSQFDNTRYGHYRGLRWLIVLREIAWLPASLLAMSRLRRERFDLVHVNEITVLPWGLLAGRMFGAPLVVHVRSLQRAPGSGWRTRLVDRWLRRRVDAVLAIDQTVARTLAEGLPLHVVHNGLARDEAARRAAQLPRPRPAQAALRVGYVGLLARHKGIHELIEAVALLRQRGVAVECLVAGVGVRQVSGLRGRALRSLGFDPDVAADLRQRVDRQGLRDCVRFLGFVGDVREIYPRLDVLCFASHLDAAGRPVFEAALFGVPSVVAVRDPPPDALIDGVTGVAIAQAEPALIADALQRLAEDEAYRQALGSRAQQWARATFAIDAAAESVLAIYRALLARRG